MKIKSFTLENFTVFEKQTLEFCEGVNVLIGANATGKTHLLKAMYCLLSVTDFLKSPSGDSFISLPSGDPLVPGPISLDFGDVFRPVNGEFYRVIRDRTGGGKATLTMCTCEHGKAVCTLVPPIEGQHGGVATTKPLKNLASINAVFFPPREVLSMFEGFAAAWGKRELSFDRTYPDMCRRLEPGPLKKLGPDEQNLVTKLVKILGGPVEQKGGGFYIKQPERKLEAHLLADGHRKLAMLVRLIANGELKEDSVLLWDEPESSLNPKLITVVAKIIRELAATGIQTFVATHDYLLTGELSVATEYKSEPNVPTRFFAFSREDPEKPDSPVTVQWGDTLADLHDNPILEEFAAHYDREQELFFGKSE